MEDRKFGFKKSDIDGSEIIFGVGQLYSIPNSFSYQNDLPKVIDQGNEPICVPCSLSSYLNWKINLDNGSSDDNKINLYSIFGNNNLDGDGMTFKEAFKRARHEGIPYEKGIVKIGHYGLIRSNLALKYGILMNGPCFGALPVYSNDKDFWNKKYDESLLAYHAISIVGYDETGFIIRNSWGRNFGNDGYTKIKYEDFNKFLEIWTVID